MKDVFYIKSLEVQNIKCFAKNTRINFYKSSESKKLSRWNLILGDNGSGKTTLLKCIYLSLADDFYLGKSEEFYKYARDENKPSVINSEICRSINVNDTVEFSENDNFRRSSFLEEFNIKINGPSIRRSRKRAPVFAYGATRNVSNNSKRDRSSRREFGASLFDENSSLISAEDWILEADYSDKLRRGNISFEKVNTILLKLFKGIISEIRVSSDKNRPTAEFKTKYGWVELSELSLGYKTIISWVIDFAYKMSDYYIETENIFLEPAIVIVDEIDLHLHVSFQKKLVKFLSNTFKNVQFIVSAHSPLVVQASSDANILLLKRVGTSARIEQNDYDISKWRIDQLYNSELFGNIGARSESASKLIRKKSNLLMKADLSKKEKEELKNIDTKLSEIPSGKTQFEMEAIELLKKAATIYKDDSNK